MSRVRASKLQPPSQIPPSTCFINKVLLDHSHAHCFLYCLWLFLYYRGRVKWLLTDTMWTTKYKIFTICFFPEKNFSPTSLVDKPRINCILFFIIKGNVCWKSMDLFQYINHHCYILKSGNWQRYFKITISNGGKSIGKQSHTLLVWV